MGKGKGKLSTWFSQLYGGSVIFEFKNLRPGRALFFFNQIRVKLPSKTVVHLKQLVIYNVSGL